VLNDDRILETELGKVVELTRADEDPKPILDEIELREVMAPETVLVARADGAKVELAYGAPVEDG
jgi:hypothetical protein